MLPAKCSPRFVDTPCFVYVIFNHILIAKIGEKQKLYVIE